MTNGWNGILDDLICQKPIKYEHYTVVSSGIRSPHQGSMLLIAALKLWLGPDLSRLHANCYSVVLIL